MALSADLLTSEILEALINKGIITSGEYAKSDAFASAVAEAVVKHVTQAAEIVVSGGSSAGKYKVT